MENQPLGSCHRHYCSLPIMKLCKFQRTHKIAVRTTSQNPQSTVASSLNQKVSTPYSSHWYLSKWDVISKYELRIRENGQQFRFLLLLTEIRLFPRNICMIWGKTINHASDMKGCMKRRNKKVDMREKGGGETGIFFLSISLLFFLHFSLCVSGRGNSNLK